MNNTSAELEKFEKTRSTRLAVTTTFEGILEVAYEEISLLPEPVGIVCAPLTSGGLGSYKKNLAELDRRIQHLQGEGKNIFRQIPYEDDMQRIKNTPYYKKGNHLLETFYKPLFESGVIKTWFFVPGWEDSYGARWERNLVEIIGGKIIDQPVIPEK